jgi:hypothetical protein
MATFTEGAHMGEFLISEAQPGTRSKDFGVIAVSQTLTDGQVVGRVLVGALSAAAAAKAGNTGNGTMGAVTVAAGTPVGVYNLEVIEPGTNAGVFRVEDPGGVEIGRGTVGVAFSAGGLGFTLADGATDFVSGDGFNITVTGATATDDGQYKALNLAATDGSQIVAGVMYGAVTTGASATAKGVVITRAAEVNGFLIDYPAGASAPQKLAIRTALNALGITVR